MIVTLSVVAVGVIVHDQGDVLEEGAERLVILHRAGELGEVFEAAGAFGRAVGLEHRGVAGFVEDQAGELGVGKLVELRRASGRNRRPGCRALRRAGAGQLVRVEDARGGDGERDLLGAGERVELRHRLVAEAALGRVDDPLEGEVVGGLGDDAQISERVADLGALVEAEAADDAVGQADRDEPVLELAGLELGADEDARSSSRRLACAAALDRLQLLADAARLLGPVPDADHLDLVALVQLGPQRLAEPAAILRDQAGGGGEDVRGRAVILLEPDDLRAGEILLEPQDIGDFCAAP